MIVIKRDGHQEELNFSKLKKVIDFACDELDCDPLELEQELIPQFKHGMTTREIQSLLIQVAVEKTSVQQPKWTFVAARLLMYDMYKESCINGFGYNKSLYDIVVDLTQRGLYGEYILESYTKEEVEELGRYIDTDRDNLIDYAGAKLLYDRYIIRDLHTGSVLELPQQMFMGIAMHIATAETKYGSDKMYWAKFWYDKASQLKFSFATPTMANARKPHHQLSSCFIDVMGDSIKGISSSLYNFMEVSKAGGGMGMYFGHIRARDSEVRNVPKASKGVVPPVKLINDITTYIDQLGTRNASISCWLDSWHMDYPEWLQLRTNSGDDRLKAHDIFPGVTFPDLYWKLAHQSMDNDWHMFCPYEIEQEMGYRLELSWGDEWEKRYFECVNNPNLRRRTMKIRDLEKLRITALIETGAVFTMNRDTVNRMNPNGHAGIILCLNLCTEIAQNTRASEFLSKTFFTRDGDKIIVTEEKAGTFVVCNLSSTVIPRNLNDDEMRETIRGQIRAMDNVIDCNDYPVPNAEITNKEYRAVGTGSMGLHHAAAIQGIRWESQEFLDFNDEWFAKFAYFAIEASANLGVERGSYDYFQGSDWQTGAFFEKRGLVGVDKYGLDWDALRAKTAKAMRNSYTMAPAPNGSTANIAGTTQSNDPILDKFWLNEKKGVTTPMVAPDLSPGSFWFYKEAHYIDQMWSIRANAIRARYIDQTQSFNLFINPETSSMRNVFEMYYQAWKLGVKSIYYVRSRSTEVDDCVSCSA